MPDSALFIEVARQQGYAIEAVQATLESVRLRLHEAGFETQRFYIYRTGDGGVGASESAANEQGARPRTLLAFQSPDTALAFAQHGGMSRSPRLIVLSLNQILAALIQRSTIGTLLIANEMSSPPGPGLLPDGILIERTALIEQLAGVAS